MSAKAKIKYQAGDSMNHLPELQLEPRQFMRGLFLSIGVRIQPSTLKFVLLARVLRLESRVGFR